MNNTEIYELGVQRMLSVMENTIDEFSDLVIQLSMSGEYSDVSDLFEQGEDVLMSVGDFLNSNDQKVQGMIKVLNGLRDIQDSFASGNCE